MQATRETCRFLTALAVVARYRRAIILPALLLAAGGFYLFVLPTGEGADPHNWITVSTIGALLVPASLLGFWTSVSALPLWVRTSGGLFAIFLLAASVAQGIHGASPLPQMEWQISTAIVIQFALTFVVFSAFRWRFRWELSSPDVPERRTTGQFSILAILVWTLEAALLAGLLRYWFQVGRVEGQPKELLAEFTAPVIIGLQLAAVGLPSIVLAWLFLARGRAQLIGAILAAISLCLLAVVMAATGSPSPNLSDAAILSAGLATMSAIILLGFRLAGDRLFRTPRQA